MGITGKDWDTNEKRGESSSVFSVKPGRLLSFPENELIAGHHILVYSST
jgi:hypothetical protein